MDLLTGEIKPIYFKYLAVAFSSAFIASVYGMLDMAMVGQYQGSVETSALAVVSPIWNIVYSLGMLMGIGDFVIFSIMCGESENNKKAFDIFGTDSILFAMPVTELPIAIFVAVMMIR